MRKQHGHGYELYNCFKRDPLENDWYIIPITMVATFIAFVAIVGVERTFNVMVEFITSI